MQNHRFLHLLGAGSRTPREILKKGFILLERPFIHQAGVATNKEPWGKCGEKQREKKVQLSKFLNLIHFVWVWVCLVYQG